MKNFLKKFLPFLAIAIVAFVGFTHSANADVTVNNWLKTAVDSISTNTGNGLANADIHVRGCYIGPGTGTPCGGGGSSDVTIGNPVIGGTPNRVLFIDANGDVADSGDFTFDSLESVFSVGTSATNLMVSPNLDSIQLEAPDKFKAISSNVAFDLSGQSNSVAFGDTEQAFGAGRVKLDNNANTFTYDNSNGLLLYSDLSQNIFRAGTQTGTDDVLLDINATTRNIGLTVNDTTNNLLTGLTIDGNDEANLVMFDVGTGMGAGFFVTNTAGVFSSDMGWTDGVLATSDFIAAPGVASMAVSDGTDVSSIVVNAAQSIAKGKLFKIDSIIDRTFASFDTQAQVAVIGDTTDSYTSSLLTLDTNNSIFNLDIKGNATTTVSNLNMNPTDGNVLSFDGDTADDIIIQLVQSDNIFGAGVSGAAMSYSETGTPNSASFAVGNFTAIGGGDNTAAMLSDNGTSSGRIFSDPANGILGIFDDADYANTFSSRLNLDNQSAQIAFEDVTNSTTSQLFGSGSEAVIGFQNASLIATSINVRDDSVGVYRAGTSSFDIIPSLGSVTLGITSSGKYLALDGAGNSLNSNLTSTGSVDFFFGSNSLLGLDGTTQTATLGIPGMARIEVNSLNNVITTVGGLIEGSTVQVNYGTTTAVVESMRDLEIGAGGSGATVANLPASPNINQKHTICDYGGTATTNTITVDAGSGKVIRSALATTGAQTYVFGADSECITLKYITTNNWKVQ